MTEQPVGRPSDFTQDIADQICAELADGKSLRTVCRAEDLPSCRTVFRWLRQFPDFRQQYEIAKEESADAMTDESVEIADDARNDWMEVHGKDGSVHYQVNGEHIQRSRLRIDTRKWYASKLKPKKYGDRLEAKVEHTGGVTLTIAPTDPEL